MKIQITYKGLDKQEKKECKRLLNEKISVLESKISSLLNADSCIRGTVEKNSKHNLVRFGATLHLPRKQISADEEGHEIQPVITEVIEELERQALKHKNRLKNTSVWKRKARRQQLKRKLLSTTMESGEAIAQETVEQASTWFDQINPYLNELHDFAVREVTYLQALGDLIPADIQPDELVDEVLVSAFEKNQEKPEDMDDKAWLFKLMLEILDCECQQSKIRRQTVSLEKVIPEEDIDTQIYEFYQPDEVLKLEDLIPVSGEVSSNVEQAQEIEEQQQLQKSLAQLPRNWRRALMLTNNIGFTQAQVAAIMNLEESLIANMIEMARQFIDAHAHQAGVVMEIEKSLQISRPFACPQDFQEELNSKFKGE